MGLAARNGNALLCGVAVCALLGLQGGASAQETQETEQTQVTTENQKKGRVTLLQRLVVGAGEEKIAINTPQAVTVIDQADIDNDQPTTIGDTLDNVPGTSVVGSDRIFGEAFNIRGIGGADDPDKSQILINVDGAAKYYEQYRMGSFFSDPELYKRVEVLRGPSSSTLYGSGGIGGVINLTTKDAADFLAEGDKGAVRVKGGYDSNGEGALASSILALRMNENAEFLAMGNYRMSGLMQNGDGDDISGSEFDSWSGLLKGTYRFGDLNEQVMRLSYQRWTGDTDDQEYSQTDSGFGTVDREVTDQTAVFSYENPASDNPWLDVKFNVSFSDTQNTQSDASGLDGVTSQLFDDTDYAYKTWQGRLENTIEHTGAGWENYLTIGTQLSNQNREAESIAGLMPGPILFHPAGTETRLGFYAQDEFIWDERLTLIPGARLDAKWNSADETVIGGQDNSDTAFSPKLAALYKLNDMFSVFGSIAHTERFPTIDELYSTSTTRTVSPNLEKEKSDNVELGIAVSSYDMVWAGDTLQVKTTGFYNRLNDQIITSTSAGGAVTGDPYYRNIDESEIYGVEIEGSYESDYFYTRAAFSGMKGQNLRTGVDLRTIPATKLALTIGKRLVDYDLDFGWRAAFFNDTPTGFANQPTPAYALHDIYASWIPDDGAWQGFEARASIENIFDTQYRNNLQGTDGKGRTFKLGLTKQINWQ